MSTGWRGNPWLIFAQPVDLAWEESNINHSAPKPSLFLPLFWQPTTQRALAVQRPWRMAPVGCEIRRRQYAIEAALLHFHPQAEIYTSKFPFCSWLCGGYEALNRRYLEIGYSCPQKAEDAHHPQWYCLRKDNNNSVWHISDPRKARSESSGDLHLPHWKQAGREEQLLKLM